MNTSLLEDEIFRTNLTIDQCKAKYATETQNLSETQPQRFCKVISDSVLCWPPTPYNSTATIRCFSELFNIKYDDTQNATRECLWNGTWSKSNYSACREIIALPADVETQTTIYFIGYTLSLVTLAIAMTIFTYFKELRCLRNTIHMNLMLSYILTYCMWIVTLISLNFGGSILCIFIVTLLHYFHITTFFWMFVEGLYLYILVVETLTRENFKLRVYAFIGWGMPMIFVLIWASVKSVIPANDDLANTCRWFESHTIDWIFQAPTLVVLLLNLVFLLCIMWVLITKLRSANTVETQQYHKAAKALLVLMPLLGITYVITIYAPTPDKTSINVFECTRAVLLSTQGFTVALFYCFLNTEVQNTLRHHFENWKTRRSLGPRSLRSGSRSKDWSPRSRTESIRLYSQPTNIYHKRESCTSELTTTTVVTVNGGGTRPTNGTPKTRSPFLYPPRPSYGGSV
ncbi:diuretic hormone receptor-like [Diorhabda sublineata]|uniref:diuretic hormone receptor-like n=1 Tax=Diorhabda sublineata TaxID=1163346 RepID=UPI0024E15F7B|nr:diuretic hormone receptor-like [Diorhabda sublineata]XP_056633388.1 diuretic hormone receptor-like [Diorhabda sublineata]XP_056633397.1 diuretic hormone receptor-like [Diorhabda sublineata]XP_056633405.1 diuretic hormone receptor-like [Diorhabda sublineata]XP_056633412.1 diuretic hormone receptor-like [Diorhabda sublineata]